MPPANVELQGLMRPTILAAKPSADCCGYAATGFLGVPTRPSIDARDQLFSRKQTTANEASAIGEKRIRTWG
jgi:hypothetical protein